MYKSSPLNQVVATDFDVIVFTSPSNVDGFLLKNNFRKNQKIIALGSTTAERLAQHGISPVLADGFSQTELFQSVSKLLS